jgi:hypothetical protein
MLPIGKHAVRLVAVITTRAAAGWALTRALPDVAGKREGAPRDVVAALDAAGGGDACAGYGRYDPRPDHVPRATCAADPTSVTYLPQRSG